MLFFLEGAQIMGWREDIGVQLCHTATEAVSKDGSLFSVSVLSSPTTFSLVSYRCITGGSLRRDQVLLPPA